MIQAFCDILLYVLHYKDPVKEKSDKFNEKMFKLGPAGQRCVREAHEAHEAHLAHLST